MDLVWGALFAAIGVAIAAAEAYALMFDKPTLSREVWRLTKAWPPLPLVVGAVIGFLCSHFWWGGGLICY